MRTNEVVTLIKKLIPITKELDFDIKSWENNTLLLSAPYEKNKNHHNTIFGGSLAMATIVSGYCMTFMTLDDRLSKAWLDEYTLVIKSFSCDYLKPVTSDFEAQSYAKQEGIDKFLEQLKRKGRARLNIVTEIKSDDILLKANAIYVAYKK